MFRPRYAYKSSINKRYRGQARGCPVFNNISDINSDMVEQHDQCLECLATIKNRTELYKTLASNKKPNNNVIKSLQRLSSSASNNRLKTCLQFLIIKVNETKIKPTEHITKNVTKKQRQQVNQKHDLRQIKGRITPPLTIVQNKDDSDSEEEEEEEEEKQSNDIIKRQQPTQNNVQQLASPPQDQVSSTQDQVNLLSPRSSPANSDTESESSHASSTSASLSQISSDDDDDDEDSSSTPLSSSPSPSSTPDLINELKCPRLKLSEEKIRKIKKRPLLFDDLDGEHSLQSTPTTSSGCSPGQHASLMFNIPAIPNVGAFHMFQAPAKFVNNLTPCNIIPKQTNQKRLPPQPQELIRCAICGVKEELPAVRRLYGPYSCTMCTAFFTSFLRQPKQFYCTQDGDCLMTVDSRCQACWMKICLQKFDINDEYRKIGQKYSPKLLSSPNVSLITIDTSVSR